MKRRLATSLSIGALALSMGSGSILAASKEQSQRKAPEPAAPALKTPSGGKPVITTTTSTTATTTVPAKQDKKRNIK